MAARVRQPINRSYSACEPIQNHVIVSPSIRQTQSPPAETDAYRVDGLTTVHSLEAQARV